MKKQFLIIFIALLVVACAGETAPTADPISPETAVALAWTEVIKQQTANAPTSTPTPLPPTSTPRPTITPTPAPQPIILTGSGDAVVDVQKWTSVALMRATYNGERNFIVENFDAAGNQIDLLVNTIGSYSGNQLIDIYDGERTARFSIKASGPWEIQILPISAIRTEMVPGLIQGVGDDVIALQGGVSDLFTADASQATSNFIVYALSQDDYYLVFNEIAPYTGAVIAKGRTLLIQVKATGNWSIDITAK